MKAPRKVSVKGTIEAKKNKVYLELQLPYSVRKKLFFTTPTPKRKIRRPQSVSGIIFGWVCQRRNSAISQQCPPDPPYK